MYGNGMKMLGTYVYIVCVSIHTGTVLLTVSFPVLFIRCLPHSPHWAQFLFYVPFVVASQIGWASAQIAHLSIVNQLTSNESERVELYAWRSELNAL